MVQLIRNDGVFRTEQRLEQAAVGIEAGAVQDRVRGAEEFADFFLERFVNTLSAANEPHRGKAIAPAVKRFVRGLNDLGMLGQAEIVVRAQVEDGLAVAHADVRILRRRDNPFPLVGAGGKDVVEL